MSREPGRTLVVAEAGVNHDGSLDQARKLVDAAVEAGADAVKFQTFRAERLVTHRAPKAEYQQGTTDRGKSQMEMLRELEFGPGEHEALLQHCRHAGIDFMSTPFDAGSARFLVEDLGLTTIKVPSGEITNAPFLLVLAGLGTDLVVSTGMSTLGEVELALGVLAFGGLHQGAEAPDFKDLSTAYASKTGKEVLRERVTLLHCTTEYPAPYESVNLRAMGTLRRALGLPVGLSDHTEGIAVPIAATARGAVLVEKHFTLDRNLPGPDHAASLEPDDLKEMVAAIRAVERGLGHGRKVPHEEERKNREVVRRGLVARLPIQEGEAFTEENLAARRPAVGLSPVYYWALLGTRAQRNYGRDEPIREATLDARRLP